MSEALSHLDQILEWVYDQSGGTSGSSVPIREYAESIGLDLDDAFTIVWTCRDAGLGEDTSGMGSPCMRITPAGLARIYNMRIRRDDPALRAGTCRTELLRWFYRQHVDAANMPTTSQFGSSADAQHEGARLTDIEIQQAADYLARKGLIKGAGAFGVRGPLRADITTEGIDCVTDWSGDIAGYLRDQRGYGPANTFNGPYIQGDAPGAQMAWQSHDFTQNQHGGQQVTPGFEPLAQAVADLIRALPTLGFSLQEQQDVQDVADEVSAEIVQDQPNRSRLRRAGAALRGFLLPIATGAVAGVSDEVRQEAGKLVEHLTSAIT